MIDSAQEKVALGAALPLDANDDSCVTTEGCGYGSCKPSSLQRCANIKAYTFNMCMVLLVHCTYYSYFIGTLRTLEKRFALSSKQTGFLTSTNDIVIIFFVLSIAYIGRKSNKARLLSCVLVFSVIANIVLAMPFFIFGPKTVRRSSEEMTANKSTESFAGYNGLLCSEKPREEICLKEDMGTESVLAFAIFILGCVFIGIGGSSNTTLGITYIEENCKKSDSSVYIGFVAAMYPWGPIIGYSLAALCTAIPEGLQDVSLSQKDPNFIGAWWIGYILIATALFCALMPMFFFPKNVMHKTTGFAMAINEGEQSILSKIKEFIHQFKKLLKNKVLWSHTLSRVCKLYVIVGVLIQQPRFLEAHYHLSASMASLITACSGSVSGIVGTLAGSFLLKRLKLKLNGIAIIVVLASIASTLGTALSMAFPCPPLDMEGQIDENTQLLNLESECNSNCTCDKIRMEPICAGGNITFFSACYAGCSSLVNGTIGNCSCIAPNVSVTPGMCEAQCNFLIPYVVCFFIVTFFAMTGQVPAVIMTLRVVEEEMRSFALGIGGTLYALFVFIPGPILFGAIVDSTCMIWQKKCGETGACLFYDIAKLRLYPHGVTLGVQGTGILLSVLAWWFIKNDPKLNISLEEQSNKTREMERRDDEDQNETS